jgi:hypothetical protein
MVRTPVAKLIARPHGQSQLYLYKDDPQELHSRFGDRDVAGVQCDLQERLVHWYINTTGIVPFDKDQCGLPPCNSTPVCAGSMEENVQKIVDRE